MNRRKALAKPNPQTALDLYDPTADELTAHVLGYLRAKGFVAWAQDNRGRYHPKTGKWYPHPNSRVGVPDILGYRKADARFIGVEVKASRDQLSTHQIDFLNELKQHGGFALVARSFEQFRESFERQGLHLPMAATAPAAAPATAEQRQLTPYPTSQPGPTATYTEPAPYHAQNPRY